MEIRLGVMDLFRSLHRGTSHLVPGKKITANILKGRSLKVCARGCDHPKASGIWWDLGVSSTLINSSPKHPQAQVCQPWFYQVKYGSKKDELRATPDDVEEVHQLNLEYKAFHVDFYAAWCFGVAVWRYATKTHGWTHDNLRIKHAVFKFLG